MTIAEAARVGCSCYALERKRRHDPTFQSWMARARESAAAAGTGRSMICARQSTSDHARGRLRQRPRQPVAGRSPQAGDAPANRTPEQELRQPFAGLTMEELREFETLRDAP